MRKIPLEKPVGIYVHIPFCAAKCAYCDFCSIPDARDLIPDYQEALIKHFIEFAPRLRGYYVDSLYFGGGTPTYYGAKNLIRLFDALKRNYSILKTAEVTLEANPESTTPDELSLLRKAGFNRISFGAQSADNELLSFLGRIHSFEQVRDAVSYAKAAGFANISIDLMFGIPAQTRQDWADTITRTVLLNPTHLSCYALKFEENTPIYISRNAPEIPDEDTQADMYLFAADTLASMGLRQYEISNFALPGYHSVHNLKYWQLKEYAAFGASAASFLGSQRYSFIRDPYAYIDAVSSGAPLVAEHEFIGDYERAAEYIMLGLRTAHGISEEEYTLIYKSNFEPFTRLLTTYSKLGLARCLNDRWSLTPRGMLISNRLIGELLDAQSELKSSSTPWRDDDYYDTLF